MEKAVYKSKTVIGLVLATVVMWAPTVGLDFTQEDAGFILENLDKVIASGFTAFAFYGRVVAKVRLRW